MVLCTTYCHSRSDVENPKARPKAWQQARNFFSSSGFFVWLAEVSPRLHGWLLPIRPDSSDCGPNGHDGNMGKTIRFCDVHSSSAFRPSFMRRLDIGRPEKHPLTEPMQINNARTDSLGDPCGVSSAIRFCSGSHSKSLGMRPEPSGLAVARRG